MVIGIDNSPLVSTHKLAHKIRGTGFYTKNLIEALQKYHPENEYVLFTQGERIEGKLDIYHYPYFEPFFLSLPFRKRGKTIITIHDLAPLVFPEMFPVGIKGKLKYSLQKLLAKRADAIITDSESSKKDIIKLLGFEQNQVYSIPLAAGEQFVKKSISREEKEMLQKKYGLPEQFALYVGDATPNKNLKRLVDAAILADIPLVMVGGALTKQDINVNHPWNRDIVYVQKKALENKKIQLLGYVTDKDLVDLYNIAELFVFPSLYEGFGLPVLEAAACGCPVVTSMGGSLPEVMGESALYIDPYSVQDISEKMTEMLTDKKIQKKYSELGLIQAGKFSWEKTANLTVKVYIHLQNTLDH